MDISQYELEAFYDELIQSDASPRPFAKELIEHLCNMPKGELQQRQKNAEHALMHKGITFTVYGHEEGTEKVLPLDLIPRVLPYEEWKTVEAGLKQRIKAINIFLEDLYNKQMILKDGVIPEELILSSRAFRKQCLGLRPPKKVWCHITGSDLIRDHAGQLYVLEDNLRCPSGVSYMLSNRQILKSMLPLAFDKNNVLPVDDYPNRLLHTLQACAHESPGAPTVVVLTPGRYNSAYFEHSFLAQSMGVELVENTDLVVEDGFVMMKTTKGFQRVDMIYRRIDDDYLDPLAFNSESLLGVPGLMEVYKAGRVSIANAPGTGVADDKVVYAYVPKIIKYYLGEEPILPNVPTYVCLEEEDKNYVLEHLDELVVKAANEAGGYGMMIGPHVDQATRDQFARLIRSNPRNYIAQPTLSLSRCPILTQEGMEGRHVDLRPYILCAGEDDIYVAPGGLTRVALVKGSLVVNSSQGGGAKDTWVIGAPEQATPSN